MGRFVIENNLLKNGWVDGYEPHGESGREPVVYGSMEDVMDVLSNYFQMQANQTGDTPPASDFRICDLDSGDIMQLTDNTEEAEDKEGRFVVEAMDEDGEWASIELEHPENGLLVKPMFGSMNEALSGVMMALERQYGELPQNRAELAKRLKEQPFRIKNLDDGETLDIQA